MIIEQPDSKVSPEEEEEATHSVYANGPVVGGSTTHASRSEPPPPAYDPNARAPFRLQSTAAASTSQFSRTSSSLDISNNGLPPVVTVTGDNAFAPPRNATNFLTVVRQNGRIKGSYAIDPSRLVPVSVLAPLQPGETEADRRNVFLQTENGSISVDLWVVGNAEKARSIAPRGKTSFTLRTENGNVTAYFHAGLPTAPRCPLDIRIYSENGFLTIRIPRTFHGPLSISTRIGAVRYSAAVKENLTRFTTKESIRKSFLGDWTHWKDGEEWTGDSMVLETDIGSVKVSFEDEAPEPPGKGFFQTIFGWI